MKRNSRLIILCILLQLPLHPAWPQAVGNDEPVDCISVSRIDRTEVIDDRTIAFHLRNGDIYVNRLNRACFGLDRRRPFSYRTATGRLCSVDVITILENFGAGLTRGASCGLGMFDPTDEEGLEMLRGLEDQPNASAESEELYEVETVEVEVDEDEPAEPQE